MRRTIQFGVTVAATAGLLALGAPAALAGGNGAQTFTQNDHNVTQVGADFNPCTGDAGTLSQTYNDVFHGTINKTGSWFTGTVEGQFSFVPDDPSKVSYTGHFATWFGDENNLRNDVEHATLNIHGTGSDGSTLSFHENAQAAINANGVITVSFDHVSCG